MWPAGADMQLTHTSAPRCSSLHLICTKWRQSTSKYHSVNSCIHPAAAHVQAGAKVAHSWASRLHASLQHSCAGGQHRLVSGGTLTFIRNSLSGGSSPRGVEDAKGSLLLVLERMSNCRDWALLKG